MRKTFLISGFVVIWVLIAIYPKGVAATDSDLMESRYRSTMKLAQDEERATNAVPDSSREWRFEWGARMHFQVYGSRPRPAEQQIGLGAQLRRMRFKVSGSMPAYNVRVYMQPSVDRGDPGLELGYIEWNPGSSTALIGGQFKVPASRQFMVSSGRLQMVDRSFADAEHRLLYGLGIMVRQQVQLGPSSMAQVYGALTTGEGRHQPAALGGYSYTVRAELLPFGAFEQYRISDLDQAQNVRLSLAAAYNLNMDAVHTRGNTGRYMDGFQSDIGTIYGDILLKYAGWSLFSQISYRSADPPHNQPRRGSVYVVNEGTAFVVQSGKMISEKVEVSGRFAGFWPSERIDHLESAEKRYSIGVSRFIRSDRLKIQADVGWIDRSANAVALDELLVRAQVQVDF